MSPDLPARQAGLNLLFFRGMFESLGVAGNDNDLRWEICGAIALVDNFLLDKK